jgi:small subunit ribosomal protein S4
MARYTGAVCRLCRRQGEKLMLKGERCSTPKCAIDRRTGPPGQRYARRRKVSERGLQLREKQKARHIYGVLERQFRKHFQEAERQAGITGENLLKILEMRLDNSVYRLGFADSRNQARQLVRHGHVLLNGRKTDIPSCAVKPGDVISWRPKSLKTQYYKTVVREIQNKYIPSWLSLDMQTLSGQVLSTPARDEMDTKINEQAIIEYYSR